MYFSILDKIKKKKAKIAVIGLGYVGLPLILKFSESGFDTIGLDTDENKIKKLKKGISYIKHIDLKNIDMGTIFLTSSYDSIKKADIIIICLPTPLDKNRGPDMSYIKNCSKNLFKVLRKGQAISLESTSYPGTTKEFFYSPYKKKFNFGKDLFLIYSPEREDPGNKVFTISNTTKIISGLTKKCEKIAEATYRNITKNIYKSKSIDTAEMTKLFENVFRSVNIGLVNELKIICDRMNINVIDIINGAKTKNFGFMPFYPGPGLGGHCIPIDPFIFSWKAREYGISARFIELSGEINSNMPNYVVEKFLRNLKTKKSFNNISILVLGVAYKKNIDDTRESPATKIIENLLQYKFKVSYNDPYINEIKVNNNKFKSIKINKNSLKNFDYIFLITDHDIYDYEFILKNSKKIIDTRNKFYDSKRVIRC